MLSAPVYLKCNEHVAVYNMTLKSSNVKWGFGYALNFLEHFWRFFFGFDSIFALYITRSLSILKTLYCPFHLLLIDLFVKSLGLGLSLE